MTVRLLDGRSEESLWSETYDREIGDVFRVQTEIAERVASALRVEMVGREQNVLRRPITSDSAAHSAYLKGRYLLNQRSREPLFSSLESFRTALRLDPHLAEAQAGLADAYSLLAWLEFLRPREAFPQAKKAALRAIELDPSLAEAHTSLGFVQFLYDRSWLEAEREFRRAISLNPNYPVAHQFYSDLLKAVGRLDEAQLEVRRALELDPLSLAINTALGHVLYLSRQYDAAIEQYRKALRLDPNFAQARLWFGRPFLEKGMFTEAITEVRAAVRLSHKSTMSLAVLGHAYASAGQRRQANRILGVLRDRARSAYVPSYLDRHGVRRSRRRGPCLRMAGASGQGAVRLAGLDQGRAPVRSSQVRSPIFEAPTPIEAHLGTGNISRRYPWVHPDREGNGTGGDRRSRVTTSGDRKSTRPFQIPMQPNLTPRLAPYLAVKNAGGLVRFIEEAMGGIAGFQEKRPDGTLGHAEVRVADGLLIDRGRSLRAAAVPCDAPSVRPRCGCRLCTSSEGGGIEGTRPHHRTEWGQARRRPGRLGERVVVHLAPRTGRSIRSEIGGPPGSRTGAGRRSSGLGSPSRSWYRPGRIA